MVIMNGDKVVARPFPETGMIFGFRAEPGTTCIDTPLALFGFDKREVTYEEFMKWACKRCAPPERMDIEDCLAEIGLKEYDAWEIVKRTNGVLVGVDDFWIDFSK